MLSEIEEQIAEGKGSAVTVADLQRFESVKMMLDRLNDMKIVDAQVLLKLYNMYRY